MPRPARVRTDATGAPVEIDGRAVEQVRESWLVEDRWWTERPLRRRYWEVLSVDGRNTVVFHDLGPDASPDLGSDAGHDRGPDASHDLGPDAAGGRARGERARAQPSGGWFCQGA